MNKIRTDGFTGVSIAGGEIIDGVHYGMVGFLNGVPQFGFPIDDNAENVLMVRCAYCGSMKSLFDNCGHCGAPPT